MPRFTPPQEARHLPRLLTQWLRLLNYGGGPPEWGGCWREHQSMDRAREGRDRFLSWARAQASPHWRIALGEREEDCRLVETGASLYRPNDMALCVGPIWMWIGEASQVLRVPVGTLKRLKFKYWLDHLVLPKIATEVIKTGLCPIQENEDVSED